LAFNINAYSQGSFTEKTFYNQGTGEGKFIAYDAKDGKKLWEADVGSGVIASPITYMINGKQYVSIVVGWGGNPGIWVRFTEENYPGTIFTFAIDANEPYAGFYKTKPKEFIQLPVSATEEEIANGQILYAANCRTCHGKMGDNGGSIPNLAYSSEGKKKSLKSRITYYILQKS
jgi:quinohemoprotein ethanol dehydrogenase